jgi:hypothetical protein
MQRDFGKGYIVDSLEREGSRGFASDGSISPII